MGQRYKEVRRGEDYDTTNYSRQGGVRYYKRRSEEWYDIPFDILVGVLTAIVGIMTASIMALAYVLGSIGSIFFDDSK